MHFPKKDNPLADLAILLQGQGKGFKAMFLPSQLAITNDISRTRTSRMRLEAASSTGSIVTSDPRSINEFPKHFEFNKVPLSFLATYYPESSTHEMQEFTPGFSEFSHNSIANNSKKRNKKDK